MRFTCSRPSSAFPPVMRSCSACACASLTPSATTSNSAPLCWSISYASEAMNDPGTSSYRVQVRFCETDLMGVVHHASYLVYCEAARVDWLHKRGVSYDSWVQHGIHLPVVEAKLRFKASARF